MVTSTQDIITFLDGIHVESFKDSEATRSQVLSAAEKLVSRLQTAYEQAWNWNFHPPVVMGALQTLQELGIWEAWSKSGGEKSLDDLVSMANDSVDPNLLRRLCRLLAAVHLIDEVGKDRYAATKVVFYLGDKENYSSYLLKGYSDHWRHGGPNLPGFLKQTGYRDPVDPQDAAFRHGNPEKLEFWNRCEEIPAFQTSFSGAMEAFSRSRHHWPEFYDTNTLLNGADLNGVLLVDVGGNIGNDISRFHARHQDVPAGSLILQDRPDALKSAKVDDKIKLMPHDIFKPQPIMGSRAYFLHSVLHDWPDKEAGQILSNLAHAMKKGYSKLLICDIALPETGASGIQAAMDVAMMALVSARERTRAEWTKLLKESGLKVVKWWEDPQKLETLIEAELI